MNILKRDMPSAAVLLGAAVTMVATLHGSDAAPERATSTPAGAPAGAADIVKLPLSFEPNLGQADPGAKFVSRGRGYTLFLNSGEAVLSLRTSEAARTSKLIGSRAPLHIPAPNARAERAESVHMKLVGASRATVVKGVDELPGKTSYFVGNDGARWHTNVPTYARVRYDRVYPGVDLVFYGNQQQLEYDFVVAPGTDPRVIQLGLEANPQQAHTSRTESVRLDDKGDLVIHTASGDVRFRKPVVYQTSSSGDRQFVDGRFAASGDRVGFEIGSYDKTRPLIIDPVLSYSTYVGGPHIDVGTAIAVDSLGNAYLTGQTCTSNFPDDGSGCDVIVTRIDSTGTALGSVVFGGDKADEASSIALDPSGNPYVTGFTCSQDFPHTTGAFQPALASKACNAFVTRLAPDLSALLYSTFLGGSKGVDGSGIGASDVGTGIAVDASGNAYVTGQTCSVDFPTRNAFQSSLNPGDFPCDAFVARLNPAGGGSSDLLYSTYLGGNSNELPGGIALDSSRLAYVAGSTASTNFPTTAGAFQPSKAGNFNGYVARFDLTKSGANSLLYSTYLGGDFDDEPEAVAVDSSDHIYVTGTTASTTFPTTQGAFQTAAAVSADPNVTPFNVFVSKLAPAGGGASDLLYSTYVGGTAGDFGRAIAVKTGNAYVAGSTCSKDFPQTSDAFQASLRGTCDAFVIKLNPAGGGSSDLRYASFLGGTEADGGSGIALDSTGNAYVSGATPSSDFPVTADAPQKTFGGAEDAFVVRLPIGNFSVAPPSSIAVGIGGSSTSSVAVNSIDEFNAPVALSFSGEPGGVAAFFNPVSVLPSAGGSASSALTITLGLAAVPGTYTVNITGTSGLLTHAASTELAVQASASGTGSIIGGITAAGCIDNSGISGTLINKLTQAQAYIDAGRIKDAINELTTVLNDLQAQGGKHITTSCTVDGQTFNPVDVLIADVQAILATLQ